MRLPVGFKESDAPFLLAFPPVLLLAVTVIAMMAAGVRGPVIDWTLLVSLSANAVFCVACLWHLNRE